MTQHTSALGDLADLAALGLVSMMLHYVIVKTVVSIGLIAQDRLLWRDKTCPART